MSRIIEEADLLLAPLFISEHRFMSLTADFFGGPCRECVLGPALARALSCELRVFHPRYRLQLWWFKSRQMPGEQLCPGRGQLYGMSADRPGAREASARLTEQNTLDDIEWLVRPERGQLFTQILAPRSRRVSRFGIEAADNILDADSAFRICWVALSRPPRARAPDDEAERARPAYVRLGDQQNLLCPPEALFGFDLSPRSSAVARPQEPGGLEAILGTPEGMPSRGTSRIRAATCSPVPRRPGEAHPGRLPPPPRQRRLPRGKDGKDLGADVDLVGPGPAYERWKKTPEYQQWLKDTGQVKK